ncbi:MAG TPA: SDR family oxidoreductase [Acidimicrobiales bacterium]|nr:SDR family oxidoreductase [Acidimicrobiales bacterium]
MSSTGLPLSGKGAVVTGGGSGIGLACARALVLDGASVTLVGRTEAKLGESAEALRTEAASGATVAFVAADVGDEDAVRSAIAAAAEPEGGLHLAVASAGTGALAPVIATPLSEWERVLATNLTGAFLTLKHAGAAIARSGGGAVCAISSIAGLRTHRQGAAYNVSKAGLDMLVRTLADELGRAGVRVNSVCPGLVETELAAGLIATDVVLADYLDNMPIARHGVVDDVAAAVRFLLGPESSWITGVSLPVDGGHHLRRGPDWDPLARMLIGDDAVDGNHTP